MKTARITAILFVGIFFITTTPGCNNGNGSNSNVAAPSNPFNTDFLGGEKHDQSNRPDPTPGPGIPIITDTNYYPLLRQGGQLTGVLTFDDDNFMGITTVILQVEGANQYFSFAVTPIEDPLNPGITTVTFTATLDPNFQPGDFTLYMGLMDEDGNVSEYLARLLVVKSIADLSIAEIIPGDGAVNVAVNTRIQVNFSLQVYPGEVEISVLHNGLPVPGAVQLSPNGRKLLFNPDDLLVPGNSYNATATILVNGNSMSSSFSTANPPPLSAPADLAGKIFGTILTKESIVEPEEGKLVFDLIMSMLAPILNKIMSLDTGTGAITTVGGLSQPDGSGGWLQSSMIPAYGPDPGALMNPWFSLGPSEFVLPLAPLGLPGNISIHDMLISGHFVADLTGVITGFERGTLTGRIDSREINVVLEAFMHRKADLCQLVSICDDEGFVPLRLEELSGFAVQGIDYLYGIECNSDVNTIQADSGGPIQVSCSTMQDGSAFQGNDITFFAATNITGSQQDVGVWDNLAAVCTGTPPTCQVGPTGQVTVQVTIAAGELTSGDITFQVGGSYSSPPGNMSISASVTVQ